MTWRANSSYAGRLGNRAGERYMRLRLFDRIRRLAHSRRPPAEATPGSSGTQGRHRRGRRRGPASGPAPAGPPTELARTATPWPGESPAPQALFPPGTQAGPTAQAGPGDRAPAEPTGAGPGPPAPGPRRGAGPPPAVRAGAARARIREAPQEAAAGPVAAAPAPRARWQDTAESAAAAARAEARADDLARVAAGVPRQPDGLGRSSWRPAVPLSQPGLPYAAAHPREQSRT